MDLYTLPAYKLSEMLKNKEISAVELAKESLSRIKAADDKLNAYITVTDELALEQAKAADERIKSGQAHALTGIPIGIKDNISTKGTLTTCASKMLYNYVPPFDATVMEKINGAGLVMTGKLNLDEFAMGGSTESSHFGTTHNPYDLSRVPGGSSGGSAAAVSSGECALALGTDTGGSIRMPAAYCGVVGLKPTYGAVSRFGAVAFASSLDQIGPIARTVTDTAMLYSLICGRDERDATSVSISHPDYAANLNADVKGMRIGIAEEYFGDGIDDEVKAAVLDRVKDLQKQGAQIVKISLPSTKYALNVYYIISSAEASSNLARFDGVRYGYRSPDCDNLLDLYVKSRSEGFGDEVKRRIMLGTFVLSSGYFDAYYNKAKRMMARIKAEYDEAFKSCDVIAAPTSPCVPFKIGENIADPIKMYQSDILTVASNIAGVCAISTPCGMSDGLPLGIQFIGNRFDEQKILNAAYAVEKIVGEMAAAKVGGAV